MRQALTHLSLMKYGVSISFESVHCQGFVKNELGEIYDFQQRVLFKICLRDGVLS